MAKKILIADIRTMEELRTRFEIIDGVRVLRMGHQKNPTILEKLLIKTGEEKNKVLVKYLAYNRMITKTYYLNEAYLLQKKHKDILGQTKTQVVAL